MGINNMKIIQIIKDDNKLIGLGDDGITYVQSRIKYSYWNEKKQEDVMTSSYFWRFIADGSHQVNDGIQFIYQDGTSKHLLCDYEEVITDDFNYKAHYE